MRLLFGLLLLGVVWTQESTTVGSKVSEETTVAGEEGVTEPELSSATEQSESEATSAGSTEEAESTTPATTTPEPYHPGHYLVVAPSTIRPNLPYAVSVNILHAEASMTVTVEVRGPDNATIASKTVEGVSVGAPQTITIPPISDEILLPEQTYTLSVKGHSAGGDAFEDSQTLNFNQKSMSTFIQTDKGIYKPGQTVKFRSVNIHPNLLPFNGTVSLQITDPNQNIIRQEERKSLSKGVYSGELELASEPPLGDWTIEVTPEGGQKLSRTFTVDQYVLPKFEVTVKPPPYIINSDDLTFLVLAKYTYGKGVAGKLKVLLDTPYNWNDDNSTKIERSLDLSPSGEATVTFTNEELKTHKLIQDWGGSIKIVATVAEALTEIERNGTADVQTYKYGVKVDIQKQGDNYKPGLPYKVLVALKQQDDTPVKANLPRGMQITTRYNYPYKWGEETKPSKVIRQKITLDSDGTYVLTVTPPLDSSSFNVEAHYDPSGRNNYTDSDINGYLYVNAATSPSKSFLQVLPVKEGSVPAEEEVSFTVKSTSEIYFLTYQVMSRGTMILSKNIQLNSGSKITTVTFPTSTEMAPKSRLIVYTVYGDRNEILVDATDFKVEGLFKNNVSLTIDKQQAEPGSAVALTVKADPNSYVGLMAVDQSILLLKSGNDITQQIVEDDISSYDTTGYGGGCCRPIPFGIARRKRSIWWPWWGIGGQDAARIFENAGLLVLTDAYLFREPQPPFWPLAVAAPGGGMAGMPGPPMPAPAPETANAFSAPSAAPRLRTLFPETWLWTDLETGVDGQVVYNTTAPDTITSWITSAFAINDQSGLGVAPDTVKLTIFRPFFVQLQLPYSVKRGEKFALQVLVFNYMETEQEVTVTLKHDQNSGFNFINKDGSIRNESTESTTESSSSHNTRIVSVPGGGISKAVYFPIIPTKIGDVMLQVTGVSTSAGDAVQQPLKVTPEGYRVDRNIPLVLTVNASGPVSQGVSLSWPQEYVEGSRHARMDVIGDIMGPVLANLDELVRMPYGCGEQNMLNFVPNIVVMKYLNATGRVEPQLEAKAKKFMEAGYQRELTYKRTDNSFSAFGQSDKAGSTWLTAFVVRSFAQARPYIFVDPNVLTNSITFLNSQQVDSGAFAEHGEVHHKDMQGGASAGGIGMTAYVTLALLENNVTNQKAIDYLESQLDSIGNDSYTLAVVTYALFLSDSPRKDDAMMALQKLKIAGNDGTLHWASSKGDSKPQTNDTWYFFQPRPVDVETTAYVLLSVMMEGNANKGLPLVRWLTAQRNSLGGFSSTQDTVIALQALAAYAQVAYSPDSNVDIAVTNGAASHQFSVGQDNSIVLQSYEIPNLDEPVNLTATGKGVVFAQISYSYYRKTLAADSPFFCTIDTKEQRGGNRIQLNMCCNYTRTGQSNMAVAEISTLSGYQYDEEELQTLTDIPGIQRKEFEQDDTKINLYFNPIGAEPVCFSLVSDLVFQVADQKPAQILLFDYYNPEDQLKATYSTQNAPPLDKSCPTCWS